MKKLGKVLATLLCGILAFCAIGCTPAISETEVFSRAKKSIEDVFDYNDNVTTQFSHTLTLSVDTDETAREVVVNEKKYLTINYKTSEYLLEYEILQTQTNTPKPQEGDTEKPKPTVSETKQTRIIYLKSSGDYYYKVDVMYDKDGKETDRDVARMSELMAIKEVGAIDINESVDSFMIPITYADDFAQYKSAYVDNVDAIVKKTIIDTSRYTSSSAGATAKVNGIDYKNGKHVLRSKVTGTLATIEDTTDTIIDNSGTIIINRDAVVENGRLGGFSLEAGYKEMVEKKTDKDTQVTNTTKTVLLVKKEQTYKYSFDRAKFNQIATLSATDSEQAYLISDSYDVDFELVVDGLVFNAYSGEATSMQEAFTLAIENSTNNDVKQLFGDTWYFDEERTQPIDINTVSEKEFYGAKRIYGTINIAPTLVVIQHQNYNTGYLLSDTYKILSGEISPSVEGGETFVVGAGAEISVPNGDSITVINGVVYTGSTYQAAQPGIHLIGTTYNLVDEDFVIANMIGELLGA